MNYARIPAHQLVPVLPSHLVVQDVLKAASVTKALSLMEATVNSSVIVVVWWKEYITR